ncbi:Leucine aminopeptidase [Asimina triloba]
MQPFSSRSFSFSYYLGFTTYAERRIVEAVQGEERAALNIGIGWRGLNEEMERFKDNMEFTKLKTKQEGVDPDDVYSQVPYEKGFQFLWRIERQIGRPAFDEFLKKYIAAFKFQSIDTETFVSFLKINVPGIENEINLDVWVHGTGIPPDAYEPVSTIYIKIVSLAKEFSLGRMPREDEVAEWQGQEWELYLENLPKTVEASQPIIMINDSIKVDAHLKGPAPRPYPEGSELAYRLCWYPRLIFDSMTTLLECLLS